MTPPTETQRVPDDHSRLWPGFVIVAIQWIARFVVPAVNPDWSQTGILISLACGPLVLLWWAFFSRVPWGERVVAILAMVAAVFVTPEFLHPSIATGNMGFMFPLYVTPPLCLALVVWAKWSRRFDRNRRYATLLATIVCVSGSFAFLQTGGNTTDLDHDFSWRWSNTPEENLLAREATSPRGATASQQGPVVGESEWPGFRGPERDSVIHGSRIRTDWSQEPPRELWRRAIGPGWSSFAVQGDLLLTQEQRGDDEVVSCYSLLDGAPLWKHRDKVRFWESVGGAGPRGTPSLAGGRVYTLGGTGLLNVLEAADGSLVWSRDAAADTATELPDWAYSASPLVVDDLVVVAVSGALIAYELGTGEPRWQLPPAGTSYSSPQLFTLDGTEQILQLNGDGLIGVEIADGTQLWNHAWSGYPIVQPAATEDGDLLISVTSSSGTRRLAVNREDGRWVVEEKWTSRGLKSYFNDFVVHQGYAYGFDGNILASIELQTGKRAWKGGRYGGGQLLLLADQDLLMVVSEKGELVLVEAQPSEFREISRFAAITGKTWNHPVFVDDVLLVRNAEEMAAFRLASESE